MRIGLFYGSSTCYTEMAAEKIQQVIEKIPGNYTVDIFNIKDEPLFKVTEYEQIILGISTWDFGEIQEDWDDAWDELDNVDFTGKVVALFGLGDQEGYPEWFLDAMGYLHDQVVFRGAKIIGHWPTLGYSFEASKAISRSYSSDAPHFVGLALDDDNESHLTEQRINLWCQQLISELQE